MKPCGQQLVQSTNPTAGMTSLYDSRYSPVKKGLSYGLIAFRLRGRRVGLLWQTVRNLSGSIADA